MRSLVVSFTLALALAACGGKSKPADSTPPPPLDPAPTEPAPAATTDADYDRVFAMGLEFFDEVAVVVETSAPDCKKMASGLEGLFVKYKPLSEDSKKIEGNPDFEERMEAYMKQHEERVKTATEKIGAGMQACGDDPDVQAAMMRFEEM